MTDKLLPCPFCGDRMEISGTIIRHRINTDCVISFQAWDYTAIDKWNTRTKPPVGRSGGIVAAFEAAHPDLYWLIAKGKIRADEPLYGAIIKTMGGEDVGAGESDVSADEAFRIAVEDAGLDLPAPQPPASGSGVSMEDEMLDMAERAVAEGQTRSSFSQLAEWAHDQISDDGGEPDA